MVAVVGDVVLFALCLYLVVAPTMAPVVLVDRGRALFVDWPTGIPPVNYLVAWFLVSLGHVVAFLSLATLSGGLEGLSILRWALVVNVGYPAACAIVAAVALPRRGIWRPTDGGIDGRVVLGLAAAWYAVVSSIASALAFAVVAILAYPG